MTRIAGVLLGMFCLLGIVGCSQYDDDYQYTPRPLTADIPATQPQQPPVATSSVTIVGVRYEDPHNNLPECIEVRMRVDNNSPDPMVFYPSSLELSNAELVRFPPAIVRPPDAVNIGPSQSAYLSAFFPFPAGLSPDTMDLNSLQLRWRLDIGSRAVGQVANFTRVWRTYYYEPDYYYGPPVGFYGGVVIVHHGRRW
jgi:hypothetical protein